MLGFPLVYLNGMRIMMFQLSGFYCRCCRFRVWVWLRDFDVGNVGLVLFCFQDRGALSFGCVNGFEPSVCSII